MIEIPEALTLARQVNETLQGEVVREAAAAHTPHKFAWYYGDPALYAARLAGRRVGPAQALAGRLEIDMGDCLLHIGEGAVLRFYPPETKLPAKHQLLLSFESGAALVGTVAMYGLFYCLGPGEGVEDNYLQAARQAVSPLSADFDEAYFAGLYKEQDGRLSAKAFMATGQRIPGLGNGVLQDILFNAGIHPRRRLDTLGPQGLNALFASLKSTLAEMVAAGGRDTERDLFGNPGGYTTKMSRLTLSLGCPACGSQVQKQAYLGGSVYFCPKCQKV